MDSYTAAVVQWAPEVLNPQKGGEKAARAIAEAAGMGAKLVVFPENWLQGYPYWSGLAPTNPEYQAFRQMSHEASIALEDPALDPVYAAAAEHDCTVVIGVQEKEGGTLYCTLLYIGPDGKMLGKHRKLVPTQAERLVWGRGDGSDLDVYATPIGRLGGLNCFEHQMAPARIALSSLNIEVHAAAWPGHAFLDGVIDASTRHLAHENACFVLVAREFMSPDLAPDEVSISDEARNHWQAHGGSAIIAPGGEYLVEPVFGKETIVTAEIDLSRIPVCKWFFDGTGHYARPDVFQLKWDKRQKPVVDMITDD